jgi:hypothetical protein
MRLGVAQAGERWSAQLPAPTEQQLRSGRSDAAGEAEQVQGAEDRHLPLPSLSAIPHLGRSSSTRPISAKTVMRTPVEGIRRDWRPPGSASS